MLQHFAGSCRLGPSHAGEAMAMEEGRLRFALPGREFVSADGRLRLFAARMGDNRGQIAPTDAASERVVAQAGRAGLTAGDDDIDQWLATPHSGLRAVLPSATGTFALAAYAGDGELLLATDALGARPLYYAASGNLLHFATAFPLLLQMLPGEHVLDRQALAELIAFSYPLGRRTLSAAVSVLRDGECLLVSAGKVRVERYHDWRDEALAERDRQAELQECAEAFRMAVASRMPVSGVQHALLSGGLDSRMIVARLREERRPVVVANCSPAGTLDEQCCSDFAREAGVPVRRVAWTPDLLQGTAGKTTTVMLKRALSCLPPGPVFSGDGGGETFGFMLISPALLAIVKQHGLALALEHLSAKERISRNVVTPDFADELDALARDGLLAEFATMRGIHPHKALQLFFLLNDLRCHLHDYFDSLDEAAHELLLPYYDRRVLQSVLRIAPPFDDYIRHRFYYDLLPLVSSLNLLAAWQSYPESIPCPKPPRAGGMTQWEFVKYIEKTYAAHWRRESLRTILHARSTAIVRYHRILAAMLFDLLAAGDHSYILRQYLALQEIFSSLGQGEA